MIPEPRRIAIHQAGHAVVQTLVSRGRYLVSHVSMDGPHAPLGQGHPARGESLIDREVMLGLYEFGLVTLAGIAAENRFQEMEPPEGEPLVALSDLAEWQQEAWSVLQSEARVRMVGLNIMRKLQDWMDNTGIWKVVENLAEELLASGTVQGLRLQRILSPLSGEAQRSPSA